MENFRKKEIILLSLAGLELSIVIFSYLLFKTHRDSESHHNVFKIEKNTEIIYPNVRKAMNGECVKQNSKIDKIQDFIAPDHVLEYKIDKNKTNLTFSTDNIELQKILKRKNAFTIKEQTDKKISFCVGSNVSNFWLSHLPLIDNVTEKELKTLGLRYQKKNKK